MTPIATPHAIDLAALVEDLRRMRRRGQQVILVSSGAIALGRRHLNLPAGPLGLEEPRFAMLARYV